MLFVGNSYVAMGALDVVTAAVFESADAPIETGRLAFGGWTLFDHVGAVQTAGSESEAEFSLGRPWVLLQEQSQIPGFPEGQELQRSRAAGERLDYHAGNAGSQTVFLMTWGRRDGDPDNPSIYPDYPTMQAALAAGYATYVEAASEDGTPAFLAPAGLAWQRVYDDLVAAGKDPLDPGSVFYTLYFEDGSHPADRGTWLTAYVIYASITGCSPVGLASLESIDDAAYLQSVAAEVVLPGGASYPAANCGGAGGSDSGEVDTGAGDPGAPPTMQIATEGCGGGCATGTTRSGAWLAGIAGLVGLLRGTRGRWRPGRAIATPTPADPSASR